MCGFNPHTHEGCDSIDAAHADDHRSFNPHTHEGCDSTRRTRKVTTRSFNPHTHEGCDVLGNLPKSAFRVSIHTPTKGVTTFAP